MYVFICVYVCTDSHKYSAIYTCARVIYTHCTQVIRKRGEYARMAQTVKCRACGADFVRGAYAVHAHMYNNCSRASARACTCIYMCAFMLRNNRSKVGTTQQCVKVSSHSGGRCTFRQRKHFYFIFQRTCHQLSFPNKFD